MSLVAIDLFGSIRSTALVALVSASFASPILVKSDAVANVGAHLKLGGGPASGQGEQLVAGGFGYEMPASWGRLGGGAVESPRDTTTKQVGAVVNSLCPGGSHGSSCEGGVQVTFIAYDGKKAASLPMLTSLERQFDARFAKEFRGFAKGKVELKPSADGSRWLGYEFVHTASGAPQQQVVAAYRHGDGSGVVAVASGPAKEVAKQREEINAFFASAQELAAE